MRTRIVVLAAGRGKRMQTEKAKVLMPLKDKPLLSHLLDSIALSKIDELPTLVVGENHEDIKGMLGDRKVQYAIQPSPMGTGHAVQCAESLLKNDADAVLVLYGDHPFVKSETITRLHDLHREGRGPLTMATIKVPDFEDWRKPLYDFGRVVRDAEGAIQSVVEKKDATQEELEIKEVNPSYFCFNALWLWENLKKLDNKNAQQEYYLTDLVRIAIQGGEHIASMDISPLEGIGVNTPEHLELATRLIDNQ